MNLNRLEFKSVIFVNDFEARKLRLVVDFKFGVSHCKRTIAGNYSTCPSTHSSQKLEILVTKKTTGTKTYRFYWKKNNNTLTSKITKQSSSSLASLSVTGLERSASTCM